MKRQNDKQPFPPELEEMMERYLAEDMNPEEIHELWSELIQYPDAIDYLKTVANLQQLSELEKQESKGGRRDGRAVIRPIRNWVWPAAAAALVLIAAIGLFRSASENEMVSPVERIELDYYRSSDDQPDLSDRENAIREAIILANRGEPNQAIQLLDSTLERVQNPIDRAELHLNAGSILYNMAQYNEAASRFEQIIDMDLNDLLLEEQAYWYLGNAYFQMNRIQEAKQAFRQTYELNGAYRRVAERYLESLPA